MNADHESKLGVVIPLKYSYLQKRCIKMVGRGLHTKSDVTDLMAGAFPEYSQHDLK